MPAGFVGGEPVGSARRARRHHDHPAGGSGERLDRGVGIGRRRPGGGGAVGHRHPARQRSGAVVSVGRTDPPTFIGDVDLSDGHGAPGRRPTRTTRTATARRAMAAPGSVIVLVLALIAGGGVLAWLLLRTPSAWCPDLVGRQLASAEFARRRTRLDDRLDVDDATGRHPAEQILSSRRAPGPTSSRGARCTSTSRSARRLVPMPQVVGQPQAAATGGARPRRGSGSGKVTPVQRREGGEGIGRLGRRAGRCRSDQVPKGARVDMVGVVGSGAAHGARRARRSVGGVGQAALAAVQLVLAHHRRLQRSAGGHRAVALAAGGHGGRPATR